MRLRTTRSADLVRWLGLWALVWACTFALGRTATETLLGLGAATAVSAFATRRAKLRATGLALPVVALGALTLRYALRPAEASALFSIGILGAVQLAALVWVQAVPWSAQHGAQRATGTLAGRLLLVSLTVTAGFLVGELWAERAFPRTPHGLVALADSPAPAPYVPDPELQHVHAPGFRGTFVHPEYDGEGLAINADGFRGAPWPKDVPAAGELRVLLLGDSTTVGFGVREDETIAARLAELLAERTAGPVHVLNGGVAGYSPCHAELVLERALDRVHPTHVVCLAYDGNDLEDCRTRFVDARAAGAHARRLPSESPGAAASSPDAPGRRGAGTLFGRTYWYRYSALYRRLEPALLPFVARAGLVEPDHAYATMLRNTRVPPPYDVAEELDLAADAVRALAARCAGASIPFVLARLPARVQTEIGSFDDLVRRYSADPRAHDRTLPGRALLDRAAADGIAVLDLLPTLEVEGRGPNPRYFLEGHPNRAGNRAIAEALLGVVD